MASTSASAGTGGSSSKNKDRANATKGSKALSTSAKRIQKELAEITVDPPPNCRYANKNICCCFAIQVHFVGV